MQPTNRYLHDRVVLILLTVIAVLTVIGVGSVLIRFDSGGNATTIAGYRPNLSSSTYVSGSSLDIYELPLYMVLVAATGVILSNKLYKIGRDTALLMLGGTVFLLVMAVVVSNALISIQ